MQWIKKFLPHRLLTSIRPAYHGTLALLGHFYFGRPSRKMIVIGVTGTNGKSTTVNLIAKILEEAGLVAGYTSTVTMKIGGQEHLNQMKMTMPSGWLLQKWMKQMVQAGCQYAVLEISSEGLQQNRHLGIDFDAAVFTNLTPEHLESHGGFANYQKAKARLFEVISKNQASRTKQTINPKLQKTIIVNADDEYGKFYSSFKADKYFSFGVKNPQADFIATDIRYSPAGVSFNLKFKTPASPTGPVDLFYGAGRFNLKLKGQFDAYNSLAAIAAAQAQNISLEPCQKALEKVEVVPGRVEVLQQQPVTVVVDYAYEPEEMRQLYETVGRWPHNRIIQVLGPTGGGRDQARIPVLGKMAGEFVDMVIVTTDDPYDDDPKLLAQRMVVGVDAYKTRDKNLFVMLDRRAAIAKALKLAVSGDLVLITGKGADQKMALANGRYQDWDDRTVAKEELGQLQMMKTKNSL